MTKNYTPEELLMGLDIKSDKHDERIQSLENSDVKTHDHTGYAAANVALTADTGTGTDTATGAVASAAVSSVLQTIWGKIRQVVNVLGTKQNNIPAGTSGNLVTYSGTAGTFGTAKAVGTGDSDVAAGNHTHSTYAPTNHATNTTTYGVATETNWGHVRLPPTSGTQPGEVMPWRLLPNTNLNEIKSPGYYKVGEETTNSPVTTGSTSDAAVLEVRSNTDTRISQTLYHNNGQIWHRVLQNTTWVAWKRIATTDDIPVSSDSIMLLPEHQPTFVTGPAHGKTSTTTYIGAVYLPNGKVLLVPYGSTGNLVTHLGLYDPITNTLTDGPAHGKSSATLFGGGVLLPNGKVILVPYSATNVGIYDPVANTYTDGPAHGKGNNAFVGGVLLPDGRVLFVPVNSTNIGLYDPATNTYTDGPAHGRGATAFFGGVLLPNGKVCLVPMTSTNVGIYDPVANTYTSGPTHGSGAINSSYSGGVLMPNGKVCLVPYRSSNVAIYDPVAGTCTSGPAHGQGDNAFAGGVRLPNGKVLFVPYGSRYVGIYDPVANTYTNGPAHGMSSTVAFRGGILTPGGDAVLVPNGATNIFKYSIGGTQLNMNFCLSPYVNKF